MKALKLVEFLGKQPGWTGIRELGREIGVPPATAHRLVQTLLSAGWVEKSPTCPKYRLSGRIEFNSLSGAEWPDFSDDRKDFGPSLDEEFSDASENVFRYGTLSAKGVVNP